LLDADVDDWSLSMVDFKVRLVAGRWSLVVRVVVVLNYVQGRSSVVPLLDSQPLRIGLRREDGWGGWL